MTDLPAARHLLKDAPATCHDEVVLSYDERLIRRKRLVTARGDGFLVDLPEVTNLDAVWGFELEDGRTVRVTAAQEAVLEITGPDLARYAWHIGNRHTPCQVEPARLVIRADHVLEAMLRQLGAGVQALSAPFTPEVGAYGMGRPMGHDHGPEGGHSHASAHSHSHGHSHGHDDHHDHDHADHHHPHDKV
ncbi:urease accessory protein UreE [Pseudotabrizicola sediminis]|uniref:Urease accessory protein UreE n=1 Tax=Pseudotabrizicola sediminis TaxID=2486418 RepID=A0ABY2KPI6_9RHOB|nr:urease accessory protein UreE [Pseudotabrizicola sediminis]TGD42938.1 urease accessory protein UreE [Pseudotabrizicola sediminis]